MDFYIVSSYSAGPQERKIDNSLLVTKYVTGYWGVRDFKIVGGGGRMTPLCLL